MEGTSKATSSTPNELGLFSHTIQTKANSIKFAHQLICSPRITTFLKAIRHGFLKGCPNLSAKGVTQYLNPSPATAKGHRNRCYLQDVLKRFYINMLMSKFGDNCRWIVSTEGDCLFAFKLDGKMWIKIYDTVCANSNPNSAGGYIEANLPNAVKPIGFTRNKSGSVKMHNAVFCTFTTMEDTGAYPR